MVPGVQIVIYGLLVLFPRWEEEVSSTFGRMVLGRMGEGIYLYLEINNLTTEGTALIVFQPQSKFRLIYYLVANIVFYKDG